MPERRRLLPAPDRAEPSGFGRPMLAWAATGHRTALAVPDTAPQAAAHA